MRTYVPNILIDVSTLYRISGLDRAIRPRDKAVEGTLWLGRTSSAL
jgi:hypothetical protein